MRSDIRPGGTFPDYSLPDHTNTFASSASSKVTIRWSSHWRGAITVRRSTSSTWSSRRTIRRSPSPTPRSSRSSTDDHHTTQEFRASVGAQWTFLSDPARTIQKDLDIQEYTDPEHDPMIPHTLVLKPGLVIHSVYNGYWFWGRPSFYDLWRDLCAASSEIRPDWDLSKPGLREAWDARRLLELPRMEQAGRQSMPTSYES